MGDVEYFWKVRRARRHGDVEFLVEALNDDIEGYIAAEYLAEIGAVSAIPAIIPLLEAADPYQRASAAMALGKLNGVVACERIMELAEQDDVPWVRSCAITGLGALSCDNGPLLVRALEDADCRVRGAAVNALMDVGQPDAIPTLRAGRKRERWFYSRRAYSKAIRRIKRRAR
jgi:HEAT repeat protein